MWRYGKLLTGLGVVVGCGLLLRVNADQPSTRGDSNSAAIEERRTWIKAEFAADSRAIAMGLPNEAITRWINLDKADNVYLYKKGKTDEARVEAGSKIYLPSDPGQLQLIRRYLVRGELR